MGNNETKGSFFEESVLLPKGKEIDFPEDESLNLNHEVFYDTLLYFARDIINLTEATYEKNIDLKTRYLDKLGICQEALFSIFTKIDTEEELKFIRNLSTIYYIKGKNSMFLFGEETTYLRESLKKVVFSKRRFFNSFREKNLSLKEKILYETLIYFARDIIDLIEAKYEKNIDLRDEYIDNLKDCQEALFNIFTKIDREKYDKFKKNLYEIFTIRQIHK